VVIPTNTPSWKVRVTTTAGEAMLLVSTNFFPNVDTGRVGPGKVMQKAGDEHYVLLPFPGQTNLAAGTNYLTVVSEGINPLLARASVPAPAPSLWKVREPADFGFGHADAGRCQHDQHP